MFSQGVSYLEGFLFRLGTKRISRDLAIYCLTQLAVFRCQVSSLRFSSPLFAYGFSPQTAPDSKLININRFGRTLFWPVDIFNEGIQTHPWASREKECLELVL